MKAPTDKRNDTVQILVTRRCDLRNCSNCTQMLPFRCDPLDMSPDVFRQALRSLEGWPGIRGVFGGNPCAHPRFADLMAILVEEVPDQRQRGLWTNNLLGHGGLVSDVFHPRGRTNLNAHGNEAAADEMARLMPGRLIHRKPSWHSPILLNWRDMGLTEAQWVEARERCDINQDWSAAIMERDGQPWAYFCEVAGAIDGVTGQNNGIPAEPGWWRFKMDRFEGQVRRCCDRGCGVPLRRLGHLDRDDTYDYSPAWASVVEPTINGRPRPRGVRHETMPQGTDKATDYQAVRTHKP